MVWIFLKKVIFTLLPLLLLESLQFFSQKTQQALLFVHFTPTTSSMQVCSFGSPKRITVLHLDCTLFCACPITCSCPINTPCSHLLEDKNISVEMVQRATIPLLFYKQLMNLPCEKEVKSWRRACFCLM